MLKNWKGQLQHFLTRQGGIWPVTKLTYSENKRDGPIRSRSVPKLSLFSSCARTSIFMRMVLSRKSLSLICLSPLFVFYSSLWSFPGIRSKSLCLCKWRSYVRTCSYLTWLSRNPWPWPMTSNLVTDWLFLWFSSDVIDSTNVFRFC